MKRKLLLLSLVIFVYTFTQAQVIPNGGFETWTSINPQGWSTFNNLVSGSVTKHTSAYEGAYAAKLETKTYLIITKAPGVITLGRITQVGSTATVDGGIAFTNKPDSLIFFAKCNVVSGDSAYIAIALYKNMDTVALGTKSIGSSITSWQRIAVGLKYRNTNTPDTLNVIFMSSQKDIAKVGSILYVDNAMLKYNSEDVYQPLMARNIEIFPNPASDYIKIDYPSGNNNYEVSIYNSLGKLMKKYATDIEKIDVSTFPKGVYFVRFNSNGNNFTKKINIL